MKYPSAANGYLHAAMFLIIAGLLTGFAGLLGVGDGILLYAAACSLGVGLLCYIASKFISGIRRD